MALSDIEVAAFLAEFRERPQERQEASPIWQELASFPQWAGAQYRGDESPALAPPPDPRLPGIEKQRQAEESGQPVEVTQQPDGTQAMTTQDTRKAANPWADHRPPPDDGSSVFVAVNTEQRPPFSGDWERRQGGWFRRGKE